MIPKKGVNYILALVISEVILLSYCEPLSNLRNDDRQIEESYDQDYEFLEVQPKVNFAVEQDESAIVELSSSQCSTRDRTQTCDCGFIDQVFKQMSILIINSVGHVLSLHNCRDSQ